MEIEAFIYKGALIVRLNGEFDMHVTEKFKNAVDTILMKTEINDIIINLSEVSFIDSSGIGAILGCYKKVKGRNGKLHFVGVEGGVSRLLSMSGLLQIIDVYETEESVMMY